MTICNTEDVAAERGRGEEIAGTDILDASENLDFWRDVPCMPLENLGDTSLRGQSGHSTS